MPTTPVLGLPYPQATDPPDGPDQIGDLALALDAAIPARSPAGTLRATIKAAADTGWLVCDGSSVLKATYPALDAILSAASYPFGSDATHFTLPDMRGRVPVGVGTHADVDALGDSDGLGVGSRTPKHAHGDGTLAAAAHTHDDGTLAAASHSHTDGTLAAAAHTHGAGTLSVASHSHGSGTLEADAHAHAAGTYAAAAHTHADGTLAVASHTHSDGSLAVAAHHHGVFFNTGTASVASFQLNYQTGGTTSPGLIGGHIHLVSGNTDDQSPDVSGATGAATPDVTGATASATPAVTGSSADGTADVSGSTATATAAVDAGATASSGADVSGSTGSSAADVAGNTGSSSADVTGATGDAAPAYLALYWQIKT
jgi:hypothetical protein